MVGRLVFCLLVWGAQGMVSAADTTSTPALVPPRLTDSAATATTIAPSPGPSSTSSTSSSPAPASIDSAAAQPAKAEAKSVEPSPAKKAALEANANHAKAMSAAADSSQIAAKAADSAKAASALLKNPIPLENARLAYFRVGGLVRGTAYAGDVSAHSDMEKTASMGIDLARMIFTGGFDDKFGFTTELDFAKGKQGLGVGQVSLQWQHGPFDRIRAGRIKRAFSREALASEADLPFNYRGRLYQDFLSKANGYTGYDVGIAFASGFEDGGVPVRYELGLYNGRSSDDPAVGYTADSWSDGDLQAKDVAFRLETQPLPGLMLEGAVTTKATDDKSDAQNFNLAMNTAYQLGAFYALRGWRAHGEVAYGDNHQGRDALIIGGSSDFLAFYLEGALRHDYGKTGRWSESLVKIEGVDPDMGFGSDEGKPNDGKLRYTLAATYGLTANNSVSLGWGLLQPVTKTRESSAKRLRHDLDLFWKLVF